MAKTILIRILFLLLISSYTQVQSTEEGFVSINISDKGLDFVKELLINGVVSSLIPLQLPQIEKSVQIPVVGKVRMVLSNITLYRVNVSSSIVKPGDTGIAIVASGATANLSMDWKYTYSTWLIPIAVSDKGSASVLVEGLDVGLTLGLKNQRGTLNLTLLECGCYVRDICIKLKGGASWLYQGLLDAFEGNIASAVEDAVSKKIREGVMKLDSALQSLPKEVPIDNVAALNVTFVNDPVLSNSSVDLEINGLFSAKGEIIASNHRHKNLRASVSSKDPDNMIGISLHENVLNSALLVYFNADLMHWIVDKIPDQALLNTARWRYVVPQLYKLYPNDDLKLNISVSSPPIIKVENEGIHGTVHSDVTLDVLDTGDVIPVVCI
ncbi:unnamed protein product [Ilex paraguariensis]|uniref:Lipid-binding serum glycoprotein N-terminal domain-containing protein n=1 Tax=Ilex paraguariensis TaxID=185542 RepID=A0ABC8T7X3_9AQUA